jgi:signal transduction histidine kinase
VTAVARLPIRLRLTAVFTAAMILALAGVGAGTVTHFRHAVDASIDDTLADRARDIPPPDGGGHLAEDADTAAQVIAADGQVRAASPRAGTAPLLTPAQVATARRHTLRLDREHVPGLPGRARLLATSDGDDSVVAVATSLAGRDQAVADLRTALLVAFPIVLLIATGAAYLLATAALRPVERMRARAAAITSETPGQRLPVPAGRDEITRLGATLNDMLDRLQTALARERDFVSDASHELRTPLALLKTELELSLRRPRSPAETDAALRAALADTDRLVDLAEDLLLLARTDRGPGSPTEPFPIAPLLCGVAKRYEPAADGRPIRLRCDPDLVATVDARQLERALNNLVDNALRHGAGPVEITVSTRDGHLTVRVRDHGPGFPAGFLPRAFDRFTRADTARTGHGSGLGLAIVAAIARRHAGTAHAANHHDGGAEVSLRLPAATGCPTPLAAVEDSPLPTYGAAPAGRRDLPEEGPS